MYTGQSHTLAAKHTEVFIPSLYTRRTKPVTASIIGKGILGITHKAFGFIIHSRRIYALRDCMLRLIDIIQIHLYLIELAV